MFATDTSQSRFSLMVARNEAKIGAVSRAGKATRPFDHNPKPNPDFSCAHQALQAQSDNGRDEAAQSSLNTISII
ncbi:hypothetical protein PSPO01_15836 [Paraphaeosphaeria sporulosa]